MTDRPARPRTARPAKASWEMSARRLPESSSSCPLPLPCEPSGRRPGLDDTARSGRMGPRLCNGFTGLGVSEALAWMPEMMASVDCGRMASRARKRARKGMFMFARSSARRPASCAARTVWRTLSGIIGRTGSGLVKSFVNIGQSYAP